MKKKNLLMNTTKTPGMTLNSMILLVIMTMTGMQVLSQPKVQVLKIGTYDSRIIIFAYSRSAFFRQHMMKFNSANDSAQKAKDTAKIRELSIQAMSYQHLLHQMVFGTGSVTAVMDLVKDKIPEIARNAGVSMVLSKWEMMYKDPSAEVIDLTEQIVQLFNPKEDIHKMMEEISKTEPVPLEELTIEDEMLDGYCRRFGLNKKN